MLSQASLKRLQECMKSSGHRLSTQRLRELYVKHEGLFNLLPNDLMLPIVQQADLSTIGALCRSNKRMLQLCRTPVYQKVIHEKLLGETRPRGLNVDPNDFMPGFKEWIQKTFKKGKHDVYLSDDTFFDMMYTDDDDEESEPYEVENVELWDVLIDTHHQPIMPGLYKQIVFHMSDDNNQLFISFGYESKAKSVALDLDSGDYVFDE